MSKPVSPQRPAKSFIALSMDGSVALLLVLSALGCSSGDSGARVGSGGATASGGSSATGGGSGAGGGSGGNAGMGGNAGEGVSGGSGGGSAGYDAALKKILDSNFRNKKEDSSPYLNTPSVDLYTKKDLYGQASAYKKSQGSYGGSVWFENEYFPGNGAATFRTSCEVSHFAYDDPAAFPGQPEASHLVMFLGNTHTNAFSTYKTLLNSGGGTCNGGELNRTAYWVPAMFDGKGNVVVPAKVRFYYKTEKAAGVGKVKVYPDNLKIIADQTSNVDGNLGLATYRCNDIYNGGKMNASNTIPKCQSPNPKKGDPGVLEYMILFDHCWNGDTSTSGDWWQNHLINLKPPSKYWHSSECPASHPILLPALVTHIFYDIKKGEDTSTWFLSSDIDPNTRALKAKRGATATAGWIGAWNKEINEEFNKNCNNKAGAECAAGLLADTASPRALRLRNDWITGPHRIPLKDIYEQMCSAHKSKPFDSKAGGALAAYCRPGKP